jgi:TRAP-type C4-dicarboxylate transport system permease small subunit
MEATRAEKTRLGIFFVTIIVLFVVPVMILGGGNLVYITYVLEQKSATLQVPLAYVYLIIPVSGLLVLFYQIVDILKILNKPLAQN